MSGQKKTSRAMARKVVPSMRKEDRAGEGQPASKALAASNEGVPDMRQPGHDARSAGDASVPSGHPGDPDPGRVADQAQVALVWHNEKRSVGSLIPNPHNPRRLTEKKASDLRKSLVKFGYVEPIALNTDGSILGGHQRINVMLAAKIVKPEDLIDVRAPNRSLTEAEKRELLLRLNLNLGDWNDDMLANEFEQADLLEWGFEPAYFAAPEPFAGIAMPKDEGAPTEIEGKIRVKGGETWSIGEHGTKLFCGDDETDPKYCEVALRVAEQAGLAVSKDTE
jgi:hypothetical protein